MRRITRHLSDIDRIEHKSKAEARGAMQQARVSTGTEKYDKIGAQVLNLLIFSPRSLLKHRTKWRGCQQS